MDVAGFDSRRSLHQLEEPMNDKWTARQLLESLSKMVDEHPDDADKPLTVECTVFPYAAPVSVGPRSARHARVWSMGWRSDIDGLHISARLGT